MGQFAQLFDADTVYNQIMPLFFNFCQHPICQVQNSAADSLADILIKLEKEEEKVKFIVKQVKALFLRHKGFKRRQIFAQMCQNLMGHKELFKTYFMPLFLKLALDPVKNVRIVVARVLESHFADKDGAFVFDITVN